MSLKIAGATVFGLAAVATTTYLQMQLVCQTQCKEPSLLGGWMGAERTCRTTCHSPSITEVAQPILKMAGIAVGAAALYQINRLRNWWTSKEAIPAIRKEIIAAASVPAAPSVVLEEEKKPAKPGPRVPVSRALVFEAKKSVNNTGVVCETLNPAEAQVIADRMVANINKAVSSAASQIVAADPDSIAHPREDDGNKFLFTGIHAPIVLPPPVQRNQNKVSQESKLVLTSQKSVAFSYAVPTVHAPIIDPPTPPSISDEPSSSN